MIGIGLIYIKIVKMNLWIGIILVNYLCNEKVMTEMWHICKYSIKASEWYVSYQLYYLNKTGYIVVNVEYLLTIKLVADVRRAAP